MRVKVTKKVAPTANASIHLTCESYICFYNSFIVACTATRNTKNSMNVMNNFLPSTHALISSNPL